MKRSSLKRAWLWLALALPLQAWAAVPTETSTPTVTPTPTVTVNCTMALLGNGSVGALGEAAVGKVLYQRVRWVNFWPDPSDPRSWLRLYVDLAGPAKARFTMYRDDGTGAYPTTPSSEEEIDLAQGWNIFRINSAVLSPRYFWVALQLDSANATLRYDSTGGVSAEQAQAYGVFPATAAAASFGTRAYSLYFPGCGGPLLDVPTQTPTQALTPLATLTSTWTRTASYTATPTRTPAAGGLFSPTPTPTRTPTAEGTAEQLKAAPVPKVYPNPVQGEAAVTVAVELEQAGLVTVTLRDALGNLIIEKAVYQPAGPVGIPLDLDGVNRGIYLYTVSIQEGSGTRILGSGKLVKQ